jgi:hypothetical protein
MKVTKRFPESIIEPREGHDPNVVVADGGTYDKVSNPTALKTVSYADGWNPSEFTIRSVTTAWSSESADILFREKKSAFVPSLGFESIQDLTIRHNKN